MQDEDYNNPGTSEACLEFPRGQWKDSTRPGSRRKLTRRTNLPPLLSQLQSLSRRRLAGRALEKWPSNSNGALKEQEQSKLAPLELFLAMPMDILAEVRRPLFSQVAQTKRKATEQICSHRSSSALLRLSRTNRLFRSLLLSRDWRCIWTAARVDAGLPAVKNLDEVQYALLLYGSCCFVSSCLPTPSCDAL